MVTDPTKASVMGDGIGLIRCNQVATFSVLGPGASIRDIGVRITGQSVPVNHSVCQSHSQSVSHPVSQSDSQSRSQSVSQSPSQSPKTVCLPVLSICLCSLPYRSVQGRPTSICPGILCHETHC